MNQSRGRFCQLYRPIGALLLALAILILLLRSCGAPTAPTGAAPATSAPATSVPPTTAPTSVPPTTAPTVAPTSAPPTALPVAPFKLHAPAASDFTADGVALSGTGQPGATVQVWDGATMVGATTVGADGTWRLTAKLGAGAHTLTARTVDAAGKTLDESAPVEVTVPAATPPPAAATPAPAATPTATPPPTPAAGAGEAYTVVSGDWLIRLSERHYGNPDEYMRIVEATNAKAATDPTYRRIANPNLIMPGQKLRIPPKQ